jgi:hypothetical protein
MPCSLFSPPWLSLPFLSLAANNPLPHSCNRPVNGFQDIIFPTNLKLTFFRMAHAFRETKGNFPEKIKNKIRSLHYFIKR